MATYETYKSELPDWLDLLRNDAMMALDEVKDALYSAAYLYERTNEDVIAFMSECIRESEGNAQCFAALENMSVFEGDEIGPRKVSVLVGRYVLDVRVGSSKGEYERARSYGQLAHYLSLSELSAEQIATYVHRRGIRASLDHFIKEEREAKEERRTTDPDDGRAGGQLPGNPIQPHSESASGTSDEPPMTRREIVKRAVSREPLSKPKRPKLDLGKMLLVEAADDLLCDILNTAVDNDVIIRLHRKPNHEGQDWKRFVIDDILG